MCPYALFLQVWSHYNFDGERSCGIIVILKYSINFARKARITAATLTK